MFMPDGSVIQDGLRHFPARSAPERDLMKIYYPVKGIVINVYAMDEEENRDGESYVADVRVLSMGLDLFRVPFALAKADVNNYIHYSPVPASSNVDFTPFDTTKIDPRKADSSTVIVSFIDGEVRQPVIIGMMPHYQSGPEGVNKTPRPGVDDGDCYRMVFNGLSFWIDKDGNLLIEQVDVFDPLLKQNYDKKIRMYLKNPLPTALSQELEVLIDNSADGSIQLRTSDSLGNEQKATLDNADNSILLESKGVVHDNSILMDADGITLTTNKDLVENITGNQTLNVTGDWNIAVTGSAKITSTTGSVELEGSGGAKAKLDSGMVGLGGPAAELLDLVDQFLTKAQTGATKAASAATASAAIVVPTAVGPSGPPTNAATFTSLAADFTTLTTDLAVIQALLSAIMGGI